MVHPDWRRKTRTWEKFNQHSLIWWWGHKRSGGERSEK